MKKSEVKKKLHGNIWRMYVISIISWFMVVMPIIVLFFQENGLSMQEIMILQAVFAIVIVVSEVPSGYFADRFGRKLSIILGVTLAGIGFSMYSFASGFWMFLLIEMLLGIGASFTSGADSALIYDSLLGLGRENEYKRMQGRLSAFGNFSEGIAGILGGFLAVISLRTPFYVEAAVLLTAIPFALTLFEPPQHKHDVIENDLEGIFDIAKYALVENKKVKWLLLYSGFSGASTLTICWLIQPYWELVGVPIAFFGILWALLQFVVGSASMIAHRVDMLLSRGTLFFISIAMVAIGYFGMALNKALWALIFIPIFYIVRGVNITLLKAYINELVPSRIRATVLSIRMLLGRLTFSIVGPFVGWIADVYTIQEALLISGITFFILGGLAILGWRRWN
jgi:MFS family permease